MDTRYAEAVLKYICFGSKIRKLGIPVHTPVFLYEKWGLRGYKFYGHGHVFLMASRTIHNSRFQKTFKQGGANVLTSSLLLIEKQGSLFSHDVTRSCT